MNKSKSKTKHFHLFPGIAILLLIGMLYPFLPGSVDPLAVPLSNVIQMFGLASLPSILIGLFLLLKPSYSLVLERILLATCFFVLIIPSLIAWFSGGKIFALLILWAGTSFVTGQKKKSKNEKQQPIQEVSIQLLFISFLCPCRP